MQIVFRCVLLACMFVSFTPAVFAQGSVAINSDGTAPHSSAMLDVKSTTRGFLAPRMSQAQRLAIASPAGGLMVYETTTNAYWVYNGSAWTQLGGSGSSKWTTTGNHIYNNNSGFVGINTSAPTERLELTGNLKLSGSAPVIRLETAQGGTGTPFASNKYAPGLQFLRQGTTTQLARIEYVDTLNSANFLRFYTGTTISNDLTISSDGNVGVGIFNPQVRLQVNGTGEIFRLHTGLDEATLQFASGLTTAATKKGFIQLSGDNLRMGTNSGNADGKFIVRNNGTDRFFIDAAGRVGINQANPAGQLHVAGRTYLNNGSSEVLAIDGTNPYVQFYQSGTARSFIQQTGTTLFMGVNGGNLRLDAAQVAIGTNLNTATGYKLAVSGKAICEELKVKLQGAWPDYVFKQEYRLRSFDELRRFIAENNHLPNIPAADELERDGMEVGDMQRRMMEKIEELTLYVLQLEEQVNELKKRMPKHE